MKKRITKAMSVFLVFLMAMSSAPLSGFVSLAANEFEAVDGLLAVRTGTDIETGSDVRTETDIRTETDTRTRTDIRTYMDIVPDEKTEVKVPKGKATYLRFVPYAGGIYTIKSISDYDTYVKLYDKDGYLLDEDDDGFGSCNFMLTAELEKNLPYYFGVSFLSRSDYGTYSVRLTVDETDCEHKNTEAFGKVETSCAAPGYTAGTYCNDCKLWIKGHTEIPALSHIDEDDNGVCDVCKNPVRNIIEDGVCGDNASYILYDDGRLVISGEGEIYDSAFFGVDDNRYDLRIKNVIIKDGITGIGEWAFEYCDNLVSVIIPDSVKSIGRNAFYSCDSLETVKIPDGVEVINCDTFGNCESLTSVKIPESVKVIEKYAFCGCGNLTSAEIPEGVESIGSYAFAYCDKITEIEIPAKVESIGEFAFAGCESLTGISVSEENENYSNDENGILYNKDKTAILYYPSGNKAESFEIPDGVTEVATHAFYYCNNLKAVEIPDSVIDIGNEAFSCCENLESIKIGESVANIRSGAFSDCYKLTSVEIPYSVTNIEEYAFCCCENILKIEINNSNCTIGNNYETFPEGATIYAPEDSTAHKYAKKFERKFVITCAHENPTVCKAVEPTCTVAGSTEGLLCEECGKWLKAAKEIAPLGHSFTNYVSDNNATCLADGTKTAICNRCTATDVVTDENTKKEHSYTGEIKANNDGTHSFKCVNGCNEYGGTVNCSGGTATCTAKAICSVCEAEYGTSLGHSFTNYIYNNDAKCGINGTETAKCDRCNETDTRTAAGTALKHNYLAKQTSAPSCTASGLMTYTCSLCKDSYTEDIDALGHSYKTVTTKATLTANGKIETKCSVCGNVSKTTVIYSPKTFTLSATKFTYTGKAIKPTVTVKDSNGNVIASSNYTVKYSANKNTGKATVTITFKGNYSGTKTLSFTITPKQVTGLKASGIKTTSLKLTWSKTAGAKYYKIEKSTNGKKWTKVTVTSKTSYTVKKLKAGTKYQFRVTALDSSKKVVGKTSKVLKTGTLTAAPKLALKSTKSKTATASWKKVKGASKYAVYKSTNGKKWTKVTTTKKTSFTIKKLTGGKKIYVRVTALNAYGKASAYSSAKNVKVKK